MKYQTVDEYIKQFPNDIQYTLQKLRLVIREAPPEAEEAISYGMPAFSLHGNPNSGL